MGTYLWQNFLTDSKVRHWISETTERLYTQLWATALVEIWPGKWAITKLIKGISGDFTVIERDERMQVGLEEILERKGRIVMGDVLETHLVEEMERPLVVGNLPYYITSPILRKFFGAESDVVGGLFMMQAEVGEKIATDAKKKSYLYWLLNYAYEVNYLKTVPPKAFTPAPKVRSCLVSLKKKEKADLPQIVFADLVKFLDVVAPYPRKTLGAIFKILGKRHKEKEGRVSKTGLLRYARNDKWASNDNILKKRLEELSREELSSLIKSGVL